MRRRKLRIKRVYEPPAPEDGYRLLVERVWPRGLRKASARIDGWHKEVAPSTELRRWFAHDPERWDAFRRRYFAELDRSPAPGLIREQLREGPVTLLFGARDECHNNARALLEYLEQGPVPPCSADRAN